MSASQSFTAQHMHTFRLCSSLWLEAPISSIGIIKAWKSIPVLLFLLLLVSAHRHLSCEEEQHKLSPRVAAIQRLIATYKAEHGIAVLRQEAAANSKGGSRKALCERLLVKNFQFSLGCNLAGNHYGAATSAFAAAIILNRTLVLDGSDEIKESCENSIYIKPWIATLEEFRPLLKSAGCDHLKDLQSGNIPNFPMGGGFTKRCGYARSQLQVIGYDDLFNCAVELFSNNEFLSAESKRRVTILFSNPTPALRFESYGLLMRNLIGFSNQTIAVAKQALEGLHKGGLHDCLGTLRMSDEVYTIGLHIRHKIVQPAFEPFYDEASERAILQFKRLHEERQFNMTLVSSSSSGSSVPRRQKCVLLVASDRAATLRHLVDFSARVGCRLSFISRDLNATVTEKQKAENYEETGPWSQASISIADWYLLTHSDYFVGSAASTFSFLIANEVAARAALHNDAGDLRSSLTGSPFLWQSPANPMAPGRLNVSDVWSYNAEAGFVVIEREIYRSQASITTCSLPPVDNQ